MKVLFHLLIIIICLPFITGAQPYSNSWIDFSGVYLRIPIVKTGLYRITSQQLIEANVDVGMPGSSYFIYNKGCEIPIFVKQDNNLILEYIEFYGEKNDGSFDSSLYTDHKQLNVYSSLFNDTASYFLSWNSAGGHLRITQEADTAFSSYSISPYCIVKRNYIYDGTFYWGSTLSDYTEGEGWFDTQFSNSGITKSFNIESFYNSGPETFIEYGIASIAASYITSSVNHRLIVNFEHSALSSYNFQTNTTGYQIIKHCDTIPSALFSGINPLKVKFYTAFSSTDIATLSYFNIKYPHTFSFENSGSFEFYLPDNLSGIKSYINITSFNGGTNPVLLDLTNMKLIPVVLKGSAYKALIPNGTDNKKCIIVNQDSVRYVSSLEKVNFVNYLSNSNKDKDYLIITNKKLWSAAEEYAAYRQITGFHPLVVDIDELYNQFAFGIKKSPLAIRNFVDFVIKEWDTMPEQLFLIGKSIHSRECKKNASNYSRNLVPSFGNPSSDILITAGLNGTLFEPAIPTGRLAAETSFDVLAYLDKIKAYESNTPELWMKQVMHLSGGGNISEQNTFSYFLSNYKNIIEDTLFGGKVITFSKNSSLPIEISITDSIRNLINSGISIMTFFGHGAATVGFDYNIDAPSLYENLNKYPFIMAYSCFSGDIHMTVPSMNEQWVLIKDKGAIGFLASVSEAYSDELNRFASEIYSQISWKNYAATIGEQHKNTIKTLESNTSDGSRYLCENLTLHCDPAVRINSFDLPDLVISPENIFFTPAQVTPELDEFTMNIVVVNKGRAFKEDIIIGIQRTLSNHTIINYDTIFRCGLFNDTLKIKIPLNVSINESGINEFCVTLDQMNQINELSELNNYACANLVIQSDELIPVFPYQYSIFPDSVVTLKASTINTVSSEIYNYAFEIDTNDNFSSVLFKKNATVIQSSGVVSWSPPITLSDSTVYFWRVGKVPDSGNINWRSSSFTYIKNKTGWSQAHHHQFQENSFRFMNYDKEIRNFSFISAPKNLRCVTYGNPSAVNYYSIIYDIDGDLDRASCCAKSSVLLVVIDSISLTPWRNSRYIGQANPNGSCECGPGAKRYFIFRSYDNTSMNQLASVLSDSIPDGDYILAYNFMPIIYSDWSNEIFDAFESLGFSTVRALPDSIPFIFFCKKGSSELEIITGDSINSIISMNTNLAGNFTYGDMISVPFGPSSKWDSAFWDYKYRELPVKDSVFLDITGVKNDFSEQLLFNDINSNTKSIDIQSIDASLYQNLKLDFFTSDNTTITPAYLKKWMLISDGIGETALNMQKGYYFYADTVDEGEIVKFSIATENISNYPMDSILISAWLQDKNNKVFPLETKRYQGLLPGEVIVTDTIIFNTKGYPGLNSIWIEVNPFDTSKDTYDQPEQFHFNNIAQKYFYVRTDITNPLLDVTFDGMHILNGDIVSPAPEIMIKLKDENNFLLLNDTSVFKLYLKAVSTGIEKRIYFGNDASKTTLLWHPAQDSKNSCEILYTPKLSDGKYQLRIQAKDISNNVSGDFDYNIDFEVVVQSTITDVFNYPNPFSTSTRFVFLLTGQDIPDEFRIQIMTVTGKMVKEIDLAAMGDINIGRNITEYQWDGRDDFGDLLANGIYFYRTIIKINGNPIEKNDTGTNHFFKQDFGKMYIMR